MKHITEEYGAETNLIESTAEEFYTMKGFLEKEGMHVRMCVMRGDIITWQAYILCDARKEGRHVK